MTRSEVVTLVLLGALFGVVAAAFLLFADVPFPTLNWLGGSLAVVALGAGFLRVAAWRSSR